jgi:hypothetical protein
MAQLSNLKPKTLNKKKMIQSSELILNPDGISFKLKHIAQ